MIETDNIKLSRLRCRLYRLKAIAISGILAQLEADHEPDIAPNDSPAYKSPLSTES